MESPGGWSVLQSVEKNALCHATFSIFIGSTTVGKCDAHAHALCSLVTNRIMTFIFFVYFILVHILIRSKISS